MTAILVGLLVLATSVWVGGLVLIVLVARAARRTLDEPARVALFRTLGRSYLPVGSTALAVLLVCVAILFADRRWNTLSTATVVLAVSIVVTLVLGVRQARGMGVLRRRALEEPGTDLTERVRTGARRAFVLRAAIIVLSMALYAVVVAALVD